MASPLVADRFLRTSATRWLDLATGVPAWLRIERCGPGDEQGAWSDRCARVSSLWHPRLAECLDYGVGAAGYRFEAYKAVAWHTRASMSAAAGGRHVSEEVSSLLAACGVTPAAVEPVPGLDDQLFAPADARAADSQSADVRRLLASGVRVRRRSAYVTLVELLEQHPATGITVTDVEAAPGAGGRTLLQHCAREARRLGWVPVTTASAARWMPHVGDVDAEAVRMALLEDRHVVLLHDGRQASEDDVRTCVRLLVTLGTAAARAHRLIRLVPRGRSSAPLRLERLGTSELIDMIVTRRSIGQYADRLRDAAEKSDGRPGPFLDKVFGRERSGDDPCAASPAAVHESLAPFGSSRRDVSSAVGIVASVGFPAWRARGTDHAAHRAERAFAESAALAARGRHGAALRLLHRRETEQQRRGRWREAGDLAVAAGRLAAVRGHPGDALSRFERADAHYARQHDDEARVAGMTWSGRTRLELGDARASEACLRAALVAAGLASEPRALPWAVASLARTLWWQGRADEAHLLLASHESGAATTPAPAATWPGSPWPAVEEVALEASCTGTMVAAFAGELASAARLAALATRQAAALGTATACLAAQRAVAHWCGALGDLDGVRTAVAALAAAAREARRPFVLMEGNVILLEALVAAERETEAAAAARRVRRAAAVAWPPWLRARADAALLAFAARCEPGRHTTHHPRPRDASAPAVPSLVHVAPRRQGLPMFDDVIEVLRICQEQEDARQALAEVAGVLRQRTGAAAAAWLVEARPRAVIPADGARAYVRSAERALDTGLAVEPYATGDGLEAGVPVRCVGTVSGAIALRWTGPLTLDPVRVMSLLSAAAAAAAPCVRALADASPPAITEGLAAELLGTSAAMQQVRLAVARAADAPFGVLVQGESGSGKELVARAIHRAGARRSRSLCAINCAALPDELLEAELFGHVKGAFTGAVGERRGLFEEADGGVLFLDEVGELSPRGQAKLLRAIQEGEIRRVGETFPRRVDVRVIAATNRDLAQAVEAGTFRRDLWYRLDVLRIVVPPLRERPENVPLLAAAFWRRATERVGSKAVLGPSALAALSRYDWPGNVRELQNVLASMAVAAPRHGTVGSSALPATLARVAAASASGTLDEARRIFEARFVRAALARAGGHRGRAAAELGLTRQGLAKLMGRLGVDAPRAGETDGSTRAIG